MNISLKTILEAAIFAAGEPVSLERLHFLFEDELEKPSKAELKQTLELLMLDNENNAIILKETASGYMFQVKPEFSPWINKLWQEKPLRHSHALMETLAIIAYRQPITRAEIEAIRGVSVSTHIVRTLLEQEWICIVGQRETPGHPSLYATTAFFLDCFNLKNLNELPSLIEFNQIQTQQEEALKEAALGRIAV